MCTVSFIPLKSKVLIVHSRDEKISRGKALAPKQYTINNHTLLFPRDNAAGGSWIGAHENGNAAVLLNGASEKHTPAPPYRKSRGLVFLEVLAAADLFQSYTRVDLDGIEPFTLILWTQQRLFQCCWDGKRKDIKELSADKPQIWSSVTLYDAGIREKRKTWFADWTHVHGRPTIDQLVDFHLSAGDNDPHNNVLMNRDNDLRTVSITALEIQEDRSVMQYSDVPAQTSSVHELIFTKAAAIL